LMLMLYSLSFTVTPSCAGVISLAAHPTLNASQWQLLYPKNTPWGTQAPTLITNNPTPSDPCPPLSYQGTLAGLNRLLRRVEFSAAPSFVWGGERERESNRVVEVVARVRDTSPPVLLPSTSSSSYDFTQRIQIEPSPSLPAIPTLSPLSAGSPYMLLYPDGGSIPFNVEVSLRGSASPPRGEPLLNFSVIPPHPVVDFSLGLASLQGLSILPGSSHGRGGLGGGGSLHFISSARHANQAFSPLLLQCSKPAPSIVLTGGNSVYTSGEAAATAKNSTLSLWVNTLGVEGGFPQVHRLEINFTHTC